ncbi:prepilin-type N-terminal cleavage/methylation domain-containing protein [Hahella sp. CCB-MM4]|uniref:type II secretion system protein n=1 Tax=Hahella sp. (strain CCB-MM4) TaxID=1926491 RepID=UPI000B9A9C0F|nr:type II secretion system protein [Hahella sp. CCB-MM4]OZG70847.1 prepilin-type N-terminal cleavage/methylation domain-containing protein [Hahella sp. CCB-MM4]
MTLRQRGFTLTELVMVIVIVGILGVAVTRFITATVGGYVDTADRQKLASAGYISSEKISRELRTALPNSIRLNASNSCIEYIPILAGTYYTSIPLDAAGNSIEAVGARVSSAVSGRAVVYPVSASALYSPSSTGAITSATATLPVGTDAITISLSANHQFDADSPARRVFIVDSPRAYCVVGGLMFLYRNYGFNSSITLPPTGGQRAVLLDNISTSTNAFDYTPASLVRNAVVNFRYTLSKNDETWQTEQEVHIRNVP